MPDQELSLAEIRTLTLDKLIEHLDILQREVNKIDLSLANHGRDAGGQPLRPDWFRRARYAMKCKQNTVQLINLQIGVLRRNADYANAFLASARALLPADTLKLLTADAEARLEGDQQPTHASA